MIRALLETKDGRRLVLLGLDAENFRRLVEDQPIVVNLRQLDPDGPPLDLPDIDIAVAWVSDLESFKDFLAELESFKDFLAEQGVRPRSEP